MKQIISFVLFVNLNCGGNSTILHRKFIKALFDILLISDNY